MTHRNIEVFGVIGGGEFGTVVANQLAPEGSEVIGFDINPTAAFPDHVKRVGFNAIARSDVIVLAVPFTAYEKLVPRLAQMVLPETLIVDVCSVKMLPTDIFKRNGLLDRPNTLMTHPLFGPQTSVAGIAGKTMVITQEKGDLAKNLLDEWQPKGLNIKRLTPEEHDREMATVHGLTFFIGRGLLNLGLQESPLGTGYFNKLMALVDTERHHSQELFETIQRFNPFAKEAREQLLATLQELHESVST